MITSIKSPFLEYKMTILRNKKTSNSLFRQTMNEASYLIAAEVLKHLQYKKVSVQTPLIKTSGKDLAQQVILVPILRAGLGLLEGFIKFLPDAEKGHIGLYRDEQTYEPVEYLFKLPKIKNKKVIVLDPMLATGNSSIAAINCPIAACSLPPALFRFTFSIPETFRSARPLPFNTANRAPSVI